MKLLEILKAEKASSRKDSIYHKVQIEFAYNTNRIEGSKLSKEQTRYIYETNTLFIEKGEKTANGDDIIETINHFHCFDYMLKIAKKPLSEIHIKEFHKILKSNTSYTRKKWFKAGEYKSKSNIVSGIETSKSNEVKNHIKTLLDNYRKKRKIKISDIIDFHFEFKKIHPFQDENGKICRLIVFKECLKNNIIPFIIEDKFKFLYYRGFLSEYPKIKDCLTDTHLSAQDKHKELRKLSIQLCKNYFLRRSSENTLIDKQEKKIIKDFVPYISNNIDDIIEKGRVEKNDSKKTIIKTSNKLTGKPAEWFNTPERRKLWWNQLEKQWKRAFKEVWLKKSGFRQMHDTAIEALFKADKLIIEGKDGYIFEEDSIEGWNALSFNLTNLLGIENLTNLTHLKCSCNNISSLKGIENLTNLTILECSINNISSLKGIENLTNLVDLRCLENNINGLKSIKNLTKLTHLRFDLNNIGSLRNIKNLTNLTYLECGGNNISSLKSIKNLTNLTYLSCSSNNISSLKDIENLTNLTNLSCGSNNISSLKDIENLTNLTYLAFDNNNINSLKSIKNLTNLTELWCSENNISSLKHIENLTKLTFLACEGNNISSLKSIKNFTNLTKLWCSENNISSLKHIENLTKLTQLWCSENNISSLKGIENLTKLTELRCSENNINSLKGIENLTKLTDLTCYENNISSLKGIENMTKLTHLLCSENNISSLKGIENMTKLTHLFCSENNISSLKGIENLTKLIHIRCYDNNISSLKSIENLLINHRADLVYIEIENNPIRKVPYNGFQCSEINEAQYLMEKFPWVSIEY